MAMTENPLLCKACGKPIVALAQYADVQEGMHWLCFHLAYEHDADPDVDCGDLSCPWGTIRLYKERLAALGIDPQSVLDDEIRRRMP